MQTHIIERDYTQCSKLASCSPFLEHVSGALEKTSQCLT